MIVALGTTAHVGKDHLGEHLRSSMGAHLAKLSEPVKRDVLEMLLRRGVSVDLDDPASKEAIRPLLEAYGRTIHEHDPLCLPRQLESTDAFARHLRGELCVITDLRYPEQADWVHRHGGLVAVIDRPGTDPINATEAFYAPQVRLRADRILLNDGGPGFCRAGEMLVRCHWPDLPGRRGEGRWQHQCAPMERHKA